MGNQGAFSEVLQSLPEFLSASCIVNGTIMNLDDIQKMGYDEFSFRSKLNMPLKLYRYYPNKVDKGKIVLYSFYSEYSWENRKKWCNIGSVQATGSAGGLNLLMAQTRLC